MTFGNFTGLVSTPQGVPEEQWEKITRMSVVDGVKWGGLACLVSGIAVAGASRFSPGFRNHLSVSAKTALIFSPGVFSYFYASHDTITRARFDIGGYLKEVEELEERKEKAFGAVVPKLGGLPVHHALANWIHDNPFKWIAGTGTAVLTGIFTMEHINHPTLKFSQRVMHTRVYTQGAVVLILCGTMLFHDHMIKHGRYTPDVNIIPAQPSTLSQEDSAITPRQQRWDLYVPLIYAPILPLIRVGLRGRASPRTINTAFFGTLALALSHAGYVLFSDSSV